MVWREDDEYLCLLFCVALEQLGWEILSAKHA